MVIKSSKRIKNVFRFKDMLAKHINSKVLHKLKCDICNSVYIGNSKQHLLVCQYELLGVSVFTEKVLKYSEKDATATGKHCHKNIVVWITLK